MVGIYKLLDVFKSEWSEEERADQINYLKTQLVEIIEEFRKCICISYTNSSEHNFLSAELLSLNKYKYDLQKHRESIKGRLKKIKDLGVRQEEINEKEIKDRAKIVEIMYSDIKSFFIDREIGFINKLIRDCISDLGELPKIRKGKKKIEIEYSIFSMGSMALGTMSPWSDLKFGILIPEKLSKKTNKC